MTMTGEQYPISAGPYEAIVCGVGAALRHYTRDGADITISYPPDDLPPRAAGNVLVPWPNRLRGGRYEFGGTSLQLALSDTDKGNAIHGLGRWSRWTAVSHQSASVTLRLDIPPQKGYPFQVLVEVTYALHERRGLSLTITATNNGATAAPFGAGWHPYLAIGDAEFDEVEVSLRADTRLVLDDAGVPTGREPVTDTDYDLRSGKSLGAVRLDDAFTDVEVEDGYVRAEVRTAATSARMWADESFRFVQIMTAPEVAGVRAVAAEPMTCAPDAFNSGDGLIVLEPGQSWTGTVGVLPL